MSFAQHPNDDDDPASMFGIPSPAAGGFGDAIYFNFGSFEDFESDQGDGGSSVSTFFIMQAGSLTDWVSEAGAAAQPILEAGH